MNWPLIVVAVVLLTLTVVFLRKNRQARQLRYIKSYPFPRVLRDKVLLKHSHLTEEQLHLVIKGLRDYFVICNKAGRKMVAMPSQVVDDAWHELILSTRLYRKFCRKALGRFLHHTPTEAMRSPTSAQEGIKRAWRVACAKDKIDPQAPNRLPLIFAIDGLLGIKNGFTYVPNCRDRHTSSSVSGYCAGHIGCVSGCSGDSGAVEFESNGGFFDGWFDSDGGGSDCGGGCGGD